MDGSYLSNFQLIELMEKFKFDEGVIRSFKGTYLSNFY
jgi:hypothetical protein